MGNADLQYYYPTNSLVTAPENPISGGTVDYGGAQFKRRSTVQKCLPNGNYFVTSWDGKCQNRWVILWSVGFNWNIRCRRRSCWMLFFSTELVGGLGRGGHQQNLERVPRLVKGFGKLIKIFPIQIKQQSVGFENKFNRLWPSENFKYRLSRSVDNDL